MSNETTIKVGIENKSIFLYHIDIGPVVTWGFPNSCIDIIIIYT